MTRDRHDLSEAGRAMGPIGEIMRQVRDGKLTADQLQLVVEGKNPFIDEIKTFLRYCVDEAFSAWIAPMENEWVFPFSERLPVGSIIGMDMDDARGIYFEIVGYTFEMNGKLLFINVELAKEYNIEANNPQTIAAYLKKYWICGILSFAKKNK